MRRTKRECVRGITRRRWGEATDELTIEIPLRHQVVYFGKRKSGKSPVFSVELEKTRNRGGTGKKSYDKFQHHRVVFWQNLSNPPFAVRLCCASCVLVESQRIDCAGTEHRLKLPGL